MRRARGRRHDNPAAPVHQPVDEKTPDAGVTLLPPGVGEHHRDWYRIAQAALALVSIGLSIAMRGAPLDDAYIYHRYAVNLAHGIGPVFNPGEWVEGFSSVTFTGILAIFALFRLPLLACSIVIEILSAAALPFALCWLARLVFTQRAREIGLLAAGLAILTPQVVHWTGKGMEASFNVLVVLLALGHILAPPSRRTPWVLLFATLTRAENLFLIPALMFVGMLSLKRDRTDYFLRVGRPFLIALGVFLLSRRLIYGAWIPNSMAAKSGPLDGVLFATNAEARWRAAGGLWKAGVEYVKGWSSGDVTTPVLVCAFLGTFLTPLRSLVILLSAIVFYGAQVFASGGDWMPEWRYLLVTTPLLCLLAARAVLALADRRWGRIGRAGAVAVILFLAFAKIHVLIPYAQRFFSDPNKRATEVWRAQMRAICPAMRPNEALLTEIIGVVGEVCMNQVILDSAGLIHDYIGANKKLAGGYMGRDGFEVQFVKRPAYIISQYPPLHDYLVSRPDFRARYTMYTGIWLRDLPAYIAVRTDVLDSSITRALAAAGYVRK